MIIRNAVKTVTLYCFVLTISAIAVVFVGFSDNSHSLETTKPKVFVFEFDSSKDLRDKGLTKKGQDKMLAKLTELDMDISCIESDWVKTTKEDYVRKHMPVDYIVITSMTEIGNTMEVHLELKKLEGEGKEKKFNLIWSTEKFVPNNDLSKIGTLFDGIADKVFAVLKGGSEDVVFTYCFDISLDKLEDKTVYIAHLKKTLPGDLTDKLKKKGFQNTYKYRLKSLDAEMADSTCRIIVVSQEIGSQSAEAIVNYRYLIKGDILVPKEGTELPVYVSVKDETSQSTVINCSGIHFQSGDKNKFIDDLAKCIIEGWKNQIVKEQRGRQ